MLEENSSRRVLSKPVVLSLAAVNKKLFLTLTILLLISNASFAQQLAEQTQAATATENKTVNVPAGTEISLVLVRTVDSRSTHRGDEIEAQTTFPVMADGHVVIPGGTFIKGNVEKLDIHGTSGELQLQNASAIFPNGYIAPMSGPLTIETDQWTAERTASTGRSVAAVTAPIIGTVAGLLIGHSANASKAMTLNGLTINPSRLKSTAIGGMVGGLVGGLVSITLFLHSHQFIVYEGAPMSMVLQRSVSLDNDKVAEAVQHSPVTIHSVAAPDPYYPAATPPTDTGICYTPGTPATPPTVIPGTPPIGDSPGTPDTVIPGTSATPPIPHPCP